MTRLSGDIGQLVGDTNNHRAVTAKKDQFDVALSNYLRGIEAHRLSLPLLDVAPQEFTKLDRWVQHAERSHDTVMELYNDYLTHCNAELSTINEGTQSHRSLLQSNRVSNVSRSRTGSVTSSRVSRVEQQSHLVLSRLQQQERDAQLEAESLRKRAEAASFRAHADADVAWADAEPTIMLSRLRLGERSHQAAI